MLIISNSLVKEILHHGDERDCLCPALINALYIACTHERKPTESMQNGLAFECATIGASAKDGQLTQLSDLKHLFNKKDGKPNIQHKRITDQINMFNEESKRRWLDIDTELGNVQVTIQRYLPELDIIIKATTDIFPTNFVDDDGSHYINADVDLKLTKDVTSTWGDYCWGSPQYMDHGQAYMHYLILEQPLDEELNKGIEHLHTRLKSLWNKESMTFFYWVWDYGKPETNNKVIKVSWDGNKRAEYIESLRKVTVRLQEWESLGFPAMPCFNSCKDCPVKECPSKMLTEVV